VGVAVGLPIVALLLPRLSAIDLTYQIRAGDLMLRAESILRADPFTFTAGGHEWLNQQWGAEVLFSLIFRAGGWPLLICFRALLGGTIGWLLYLSCRAVGAPMKMAAGLTIGGLVLAFAGFILRPQILGLALFALCLWIVTCRSSRPLLLWAIPPVVALWANLHGSFFLGPLLLGLAYVEDRLLRRPSARPTLLVAAVAAFAANLNPFGLRVWGYALGIARNHEITDTIVEWRPPTIRTALGLLFFVSVLAVVLFLARYPGPVPWPTLLSLGVFLLAGLFATRGVFWWALVMPVAVASLIRTPVLEIEPREPRLLLNTAFVAMLVLLGLAFLPWWRGGTRDLGSNLLTDAPRGITAAAASALEPGDRLFNPQLWGSWFEFALRGHLVFVDSRIEVIPVAVWRDYDVVSGARDGWQSVLDRWRIQVVVAERRQQAALIPALRRDPNWLVLYSDAVGEVFVRR